MVIVNKHVGFKPSFGTMESVIHVDRGTDWGNPFVMKTQTQKERDRVCDLFEQYAKWRVTVEPEWLKTLRGKSLACWCHPKRCHAETLMRLANE